MKQFKTYLFDFDGTLFDSLKSSKYVFMKAYDLVGVKIKEEDVLEYTRIPVREIYTRLGVPMDKWETFFNAIAPLVNSKESLDLIDIYDDTYETMLDLYSQEATLGIVTSNSATHVYDTLKKFNLDFDIFKTVVGYELSPLSKPDPSPILKALELLNLKPNKDDICYIGDALNDCLAAERAGVTPILLDRHDEYKDTKYLKISSLSLLK